MSHYTDDCEAIRRLAAQYNWCLDAGEIEGWVACFTEDGVFSCVGLPEGDPRGGSHKGHDAIRAYHQGHFAINKGRVRHWNWNLLIDVDGDEATLRCYFNAFGAGRADSAELRFTGFYRDTLRRTGDGWLFVTREVTLDPA